MKKILLLLLLPLLLFGEDFRFADKMKDLDPSVQEHLLATLDEFSRTKTGSFLLKNISPDVQFRTRAMSNLGYADSRNVITLEALRLSSTIPPEKSARHSGIKLCFTAEILAHELLHNAQFHKELFRFPADFSGYAAVQCERLLEIQAKYTGESMFFELSQLDPYKGKVAPKAGLFLVLQRTSKTPEEDYVLSLWRNSRTTPSGARLWREQIREVSHWNRFYAEQAFRNHWRRFLEQKTGTAGLDQHLDRILQFTGFPVTAKTLLKNSSVQPVPGGIVLMENGKKILEFTAVPDGYVKRTYSGTVVKEQKIRCLNNPSSGFFR